MAPKSWYFEMKICHKCKKEVLSTERVGRRDACAYCSADLRVCLNCAFYSPGTSNECKEPSVERVIDKERGNFCEHFAFKEEDKAPRTNDLTKKDPLEELKKLF